MKEDKKDKKDKKNIGIRIPLRTRNILNCIFFFLVFPLC